MTGLEKKAQEVKDKYSIPDSQWQGFFEDLGELLALSIESNKPYLAEIDRHIVRSIKDTGGMGQIQINLNVYKYKINNMVVSCISKVKFDV